MRAKTARRYLKRNKEKIIMAAYNHINNKYVRQAEKCIKALKDDNDRDREKAYN